MLPAAMSVLPTESLASLHTVTDSTQQAVDAAWNQLCVQLRLRFIERLMHLAPVTDSLMPQRQQVVSGVSAERQQAVSGLCALLPVGQVESQYRVIRQQQLSALFDESLQGVTKLPPSVGKLVGVFCETMSRVLLMMSQDFELFVAGSLNIALDQVYQTLTDIYCEQIQLQVETIVNKLYRFTSHFYFTANFGHVHCYRLFT